VSGIHHWYAQAEYRHSRICALGETGSQARFGIGRWITFYDY
jgi:hypothetical protein